MKTAYPSAKWAYTCTRTGMKPLNTGQNTAAQKLTGGRAVSVNAPVPLQNMAGLYIFMQMIIQGCSTYRQGTPKHGERNLTDGLLWNALTSVRKRIIN